VNSLGLMGRFENTYVGHIRWGRPQKNCGIRAFSKS